MKAPGERLRAIASRLFSAKTMTRLVDPALADVQNEYRDATRNQQVWRSRWILLIGYGAFFKTLGLHGIAVSADAAVRGYVSSRGVIGRGLAFSAGLTAIVTLVLIFPPLLQVTGPRIPNPPAGHLQTLNLWALSLYLIPQALPLALPFAFSLGVLWTFGERLGSADIRKLVMTLALILTAFSFANLGWIIPTSNQAFRTAIFGQAVAKGTNELTLTELRRAVHDTGYAAAVVPAQNGDRSVAFSYYMRWALVFTPLTFAMFVMSLKKGSIARGILICLAFLVYYQLAYGGRALALTGTLPILVAVWFPNVTLAALSAVLAYRNATTPWASRE
jgi:lipopolysaccharide export LptBFGC system permease protein LptF